MCAMKNLLKLPKSMQYLRKLNFEWGTRFFWNENRKAADNYENKCNPIIFITSRGWLGPGRSHRENT